MVVHHSTDFSYSISNKWNKLRIGLECALLEASSSISSKCSVLYFWAVSLVTPTFLLHSSLWWRNFVAEDINQGGTDWFHRQIHSLRLMEANQKLHRSNYTSLYLEAHSNLPSTKEISDKTLSAGYFSITPTKWWYLHFLRLYTIARNCKSRRSYLIILAILIKNRIECLHVCAGYILQKLKAIFKA